MIAHRDIRQGTKPWYEIRLGIPTASNFDQIVTAGGKKGEKPQRSKSARKYLYRLVTERLINRPVETDLQQSNVDSIRRGRVLEPEAADILQGIMGRQLNLIGFVQSDDRRLGCSPDREVDGANQCVEIKCPYSHTHMGYLLDGNDMEKYRQQVQGQMWVGEYESSIFFSWHPQMPTVRMIYHRDEMFIAVMQQIIGEFLDELDYETARARQMGDYVTTNWAIPDTEGIDYAA